MDVRIATTLGSLWHPSRTGQAGH